MNNIEVEFTPITEATEVIKELVYKNYLQAVDEELIDTQIETDIANYLNELREDIFCVIEYPYVDKVYRDSYYHYYSAKHMQYKRDTIRVSLFEGELNPNDFLNPEKAEEIKKRYLGFYVIRPTLKALNGRAVINPNAMVENGFKICKSKVESLVYGVKVATEGFPHSSQDGETIKCAETTIWAIMEYFGTKYPEYRPTLPSSIHKVLERFSFQRQLPSDGLTMEQISFALKEFGFATRVYSFDPYDTSIYSIIDSYVESGIPVAVGLGGSGYGHVVIAMGKLYETKYKLDDIPMREFYGRGREIKYWDTTDIPAKYVVQDDNMTPYKVISLDKPGEHYKDTESQNYEIDSAVIPLYSKINLETVVARALALQIIKDATLGFDFGDGFVFRCFLSSSRTFKSHVTQSKELSKELKANLLLVRMPKFIWCAEIYTKEEFEKERKEVAGLLVLDATEANQVRVDALIFAGYPDRCIVLNDNNLVMLHEKFKNYTYFSNLK